ncbi:MAG: hypothetical protein WC069_02495 [Candidatus Shapirobacteria bacterium]
MAKKHKEVKFGIESMMRLGVFAVLIYLAIGYLSTTNSNINIPKITPQVLGDYSPKIEQTQKWINTEVVKLKEQALDQFFAKIKSSILK